MIRPCSRFTKDLKVSRPGHFKGRQVEDAPGRADPVSFAIGRESFDSERSPGSVNNVRVAVMEVAVHQQARPNDVDAAHDLSLAVLDVQPQARVTERSKAWRQYGRVMREQHVDALVPYSIGQCLDIGVGDLLR